MAGKTLRLITINEGEEAIIKVNSAVPITLDFKGHVITAWAGNGMIFQRLSTSEEVVDTKEKRVVEVDDDAETIIDEEVCTEIVRLLDDDACTEIEDYDEEGFTQLEEYDETPPPSVIDEPPEIVRYRNPISHNREYEDLQKDLFGCQWECVCDYPCIA
jgi:hypothetical protein